MPVGSLLQAWPFEIAGVLLTILVGFFLAVVLQAADGGGVLDRFGRLELIAQSARLARLLLPRILFDLRPLGLLGACDAGGDVGDGPTHAVVIDRGRRMACVS